MYGGQMTERVSAAGDAEGAGGLLGTTTTMVGGGAGGAEHAESRIGHAESRRCAERRAFFEERAVTGNERTAFHA